MGFAILLLLVGMRRFLSTAIRATPPPWPKFNVSPVVRKAIEMGNPVVALESTIISHGMPYPRNVAVATAVEEVVRRNGATPATIAIIDGVISVGLSPADIERLGKMGADGVTKASRRDLGPVIAAGGCASTTVASTMCARCFCG